MTRPAVLLERFHRRLEADAPDKAERVLARLRQDAPQSPERSRAEVEWCRVQGEDDAALERLEAHVRTWPDDADALHQLGGMYVERERTRDAAAAWLRVRALDEQADREAGVGRPADEARIAEIAEAVLKDLPEPFFSGLASVPIVLEPRPSVHLVEAAFDPRAYGLFEGADHALAHSLEAPPTPTRIVLFTHNLLVDFADPDELEAQVDITVRHEVGHYFGLDEDDLDRLGLG